MGRGCRGGGAPGAARGAARAHLPPVPRAPLRLLRHPRRAPSAPRRSERAHRDADPPAPPAPSPAPTAAPTASAWRGWRRKTAACASWWRTCGPRCRAVTRAAWRCRCARSRGGRGWAGKDGTPATAADREPLLGRRGRAGGSPPGLSLLAVQPLHPLGASLLLTLPVPSPNPSPTEETIPSRTRLLLRSDPGPDASWKPGRAHIGL